MTPAITQLSLVDIAQCRKMHHCFLCECVWIDYSKALHNLITSIRFERETPITKPQNSNTLVKKAAAK
jgi:hypothetical protein